MTDSVKIFSNTQFWQNEKLYEVREMKTLLCSGQWSWSVVMTGVCHGGHWTWGGEVVTGIVRGSPNRIVAGNFLAQSSENDCYSVLYLHVWSSLYYPWVRWWGQLLPWFYCWTQRADTVSAAPLASGLTHTLSCCCPTNIKSVLKSQCPSVQDLISRTIRQDQWLSRWIRYD